MSACECVDIAVPAEKFAKLKRFAFPCKVKAESSCAHVKTDPVIKIFPRGETPSGIHPQYLVIPSRHFVIKERGRTSSDRPFPSEVYLTGGEGVWILDREHLAFRPEGDPALEGKEGFRDVDHAVYFSQLTAALLAGSRVKVAELKKMSPGAYRSCFIRDLEVSQYLVASKEFLCMVWADGRKQYVRDRDHRSKEIQEFREKGALHFIVAAKLFRNDDLASTNVGVARGKYVAFDFDNCGIISAHLDRFKQRSGWGFSAGGIDKAAWVSPSEGEAFMGPKRWMDRRSEETRNYHQDQNIWRSLWHNHGCIQIQYFLYFKWLIQAFTASWLKNIQVGFIGDSGQAREVLRKAEMIREDVYGGLLESALFRLDLFLRSDEYQLKLQSDFQTYNANQWPSEKPKNQKYRLVLNRELFETLKAAFLLPTGFARLGQDARCTYLQFLVLLSHLRLTDSFSDEKAEIFPDKTSFDQMVVSLEENQAQQFAFFKYLFDRVSYESSYEELFFLCKVFQIFYPTLESVKKNSWLTFGGLDVNVGGEERKFYFPHEAKWAFTHFSVAELKGEKAHLTYLPGVSDAEKIGRVSAREACLEMAQLIRHGDI